MRLVGRRILLIISGGIAAYKSLELIRLLKRAGASVQPVITKGGAQFVTPLSASALAGAKAYTDLWSLDDESEMGHIRLSRENDLIVVAPASADLMAKMANGFADDLASTTLLASNRPVLVCPAMNPMMWDHPATQANIETLKSRGILFEGPQPGDMACGETGTGRLSEAADIFAAIERFFETHKGRLAGRRAIVTSGPTHEAIDPVRYIANRSSGRQGHAIAAALARAGADVTLVSGPVAIADPVGVNTLHVETAAQMMDAVTSALPADIAVFAAAVADWRVDDAGDAKIKKQEGKTAPSLTLVENADILKTVSQLKANRPRIVVGFAAETGLVEQDLKAKLARKGCDFLLANDVTGGAVFGQSDTTLQFLAHNRAAQDWGALTKADAAEKLVETLIVELEKKP